jgi:hypothetical protein
MHALVIAIFTICTVLVACAINNDKLGQTPCADSLTIVALLVALTLFLDRFTPALVELSLAILVVFSTMDLRCILTRRTAVPTPSNATVV